MKCNESFDINDLCANIDGLSRTYECYIPQKCDMILNYKNKNELTQNIIEEEKRFFDKFGTYMYNLRPSTYEYNGRCIVNSITGAQLLSKSGLGTKEFYSIKNKFYYKPSHDSSLFDLVEASKEERSSIYGSMME
jgi:hypothetical protein